MQDKNLSPIHLFRGFKKLGEDQGGIPRVAFPAPLGHTHAMASHHRIGVIGDTGHGDYGHGLDTVWLDHADCEIVAVSDPDPQGLAQAAKRLKTDRTFSNYGTMLETVPMDIVTICPRWIEQHRDMALAALDRGLHVYMEKPFCRSLEEADSLVAACERTHSRLALALPTRFNPKLKAARALIRDGAIGRVLEYRARGKEDRRGGAEDLWVLGTHVLDVIRYLGGHPKWCFANVTTENRLITARDIVQGAEGIGILAGDAVHALYGMPDGSTATFQSVRNTAGSPSRYGLQIYGSKGILEILEGPFDQVKYLNDPSWSPGRSGAQWQDVSSAGIGKPEPLTDPTFESRHFHATRNLLDAIENHREPESSVYDARATTEMIAAVFESHPLGAAVPLPLANRRNPLSMLEETRI